MGLAGISVPQLAIILLIAIAIFGTKRLRTVGGDLGAALRSFRQAMNAPDKPQRAPAVEPSEGERLTDLGSLGLDRTTKEPPPKLAGDRAD